MDGARYLLSKPEFQRSHQFVGGNTTEYTTNRKIDTRCRWWDNRLMSSISMITVGNKGRVVVPKRIRDLVGLEEGVRVAAFVDDLGRVVLETPEAVKARIRLRASLSEDSQGSAVDQLLEERRRDSSLLDSKSGTPR